ncbi:hypothetical protein [Protofrankia symbiont of Coriaria ruscifolia]|uniref:hypothetical protein n=1 Tax=Protofrankia symbiont of Coriaria ruscifolia TaxID=1306542 RepID=UPI0013EF9E82|nr:hypothetical protein [Protofrankia symbiont of Coriaria ruscifolia]
MHTALLNTQAARGPAATLAELIEALRVEQVRGCPEHRRTPSDSPAVCAERRRILETAR